MLVAERNEEIIRYIREHGICTIAELSKRFGVSQVTVHRVLNDLEAEGIVQKVRGGVRPVETQGLEKSFDIRYRRQIAEKRQMARTALEFLTEDSTIFLDSSTSMVYFAEEIARSFTMPLTVITDSPLVVNEFLKSPHIQVISTGGDLQHELNTFAGPLAFEAIDKLLFEKAFISAAAIDPERGIMTAQSVLVGLIGKIIERAEEANLLIDHTKFTKLAPLVISPATSIRRIISDGALPEETAERYRSLGIEVCTGTKRTG